MVRSLPSVVAATLVAVGLSQSPAAAQQLATANALSSTVLYGAVPMAPVPASVTMTAAAVAANTEGVAAGPTFLRASAAPRGIVRPILLPALYAMQGALQVLDVRSTFTAIAQGAHEANPVMKPFAKNQAAMLGLKAGVAASTIWMSERMWRRGNRAGAIATMLASNAVTAFVVAHNYQLVTRLQP
jgi:uncharacterized protein DUF5658